MKKFACLFAAFIFIMSCTVQAKTYTIYCENSVSIEGYAEPLDNVTFIVFKPGKTFDDYNGTNAMDVFAAYDETTASDDGKYSIDFVTTLPSGKYPLSVSVESCDTATDDVIYYINMSENLIARVMFDIAPNKEDFLLQNKYALGLNDEIVTESAVADTVKLYLAENLVTESLSYEQARSVFNKAAAVAALNNGDIYINPDNVEIFAQGDDITARLTENFMNADACRMLNSYLGKNYDKIPQFEDDLLNALVLTTVKYADGYGFVRDILKDYASKFDINESHITNDVAKKLAGNTYTTMDMLKNAIEDIYDDKKDDNGNSSSHKSSGGGGSGGKVSSVTAPVTNTDDGYGEEEKKDFTDLNGYEWAQEAINTLSKLGVINGRAPGIFAPGQNVLREEFVKIALKSADIADLYGEMHFDDVKESDWFYRDVKNAYLSGVVSGISETLFGSGQYVTRQDMAVILYNVLVKKGIEINMQSPVQFADAGDISDYAVHAVEALSSMRIVNGDDNGRFNPRSNANRAEATKMVQAILPYIGR